MKTEIKVIFYVKTIEATIINDVRQLKNIVLNFKNFYLVFLETRQV